MAYIEILRFVDGFKSRYYQGDREHALHQEVPERPSPLHTPTFDAKLVFVAWALDPKVERNTPIDAKIATLEAKELLPRTTREGIMGGIVDKRLRGMGVVDTDTATAAQIATATAALTDPLGAFYNVGFARLKAFDDSIVALRKQRL